MGSESFSSTDGSAMRLPEVPTTLMGWGRSPVSTGLVVSPTSAPEVSAAIVADGPSAERGVIARGWVGPTGIRRSELAVEWSTCASCAISTSRQMAWSLPARARR